MTIHFLMIEVVLQPSPQALHQAIETQLNKHGEPLRWAITHLNLERQTIQVEAVVTVGQWNHRA